VKAEVFNLNGVKGLFRVVQDLSFRCVEEDTSTCNVADVRKDGGAVCSQCDLGEQPDVSASLAARSSSVSKNKTDAAQKGRPLS
jgi:hypothetical protein